MLAGNEQALSRRIDRASSPLSRVGRCHRHLRALHNDRPLPVVRPSSEESAGWSFRPATNLQQAPTRLGVGAGSEGKTFRVEVTAYKANNLKRISRYVKSNRVYYIPFDKLSEQFIRIHREGGKIASITPVG